MSATASKIDTRIAFYSNSQGYVEMGVNSVGTEFACIVVEVQTSGYPLRVSYEGDSLETAQNDMRIRARGLKNRQEYLKTGS